MINGPKHGSNLNRSTFIIFIDPCGGISVEKKSLSMICKILELFVNPMTADEKYSLLK